MHTDRRKKLAFYSLLRGAKRQISYNPEFAMSVRTPVDARLVRATKIYSIKRLHLSSHLALYSTKRYVVTLLK